MSSVADYIFTVNNESKLGLQLSGGADSALLLYMLCLYKKQIRPEVEIIPLVFQEEEKNYQFKATSDIIDLVSNLTEVSLHPFIFQPTPQQDLELVRRIEARNLYLKKIIDCIFSGINANPPVFVCDKWINSDQLDLTRSTSNVELFFQRFIFADKVCYGYRPFANLNKQEIFKLYQHYQLLDNLFPLTRSCSKQGTHTISHCGKCFQCFERYWGFGRY